MAVGVPVVKDDDVQDLVERFFDDYMKTPEGRKRLLDVLARDLKGRRHIGGRGMRRAMAVLDAAQKDGHDVQGLRQLFSQIDSAAPAT